MSSELYSVLSAGPLALVGAVIAVPIYYAAYRRTPRSGERISPARYLLTIVLAGAVGGVVGMMAGIAVACAPADAGNLCGLTGVFGTGPLLSAVAILGSAHFQTRSARKRT